MGTQIHTSIEVEAIPATPEYALDIPTEHTITLKTKGRGVIGKIDMLADGRLRLVDEKNRVWVVETHKIWEELGAL